MVAAQVEECQVGEVSDLGGDGAREFVVAQPEQLKVGEVPDLWGDVSREVVAPQDKVSEVASLYRDSVPVVKCLHAGWYRGCVPSSAVCPFASVGCSVEGFKGIEGGFNLLFSLLLSHFLAGGPVRPVCRLSEC